MKRSEKRILTTHVGSLIRPKELRDLAAATQKSPPEKQRYEDLLRKSVEDVVKMQAKVGIDIVDDGEYGKSSWANYIVDRITGFELRPGDMRPIEWLGRDLQRFPEVMAAEFRGFAEGGGMPARVCVAPIQYRDSGSIQRDIRNLQSALRSVSVEEAFLPVVAPASAAFDGINEYYSSEKEYIYALADALRNEYRAIHESGLVLQVDDAVLANMYDHLVQKSPEHYRRWAGLRIEALNHALQRIPEDRVRYHVCFGSWHVPHLADAPLEEIVGFILQVHAGAYSIEGANPRHEHEWRVWESRKLPAGKILIPGVITHHTITVEHPRLVADRIVRFARLVGRENVIAGADCGFAQTEMLQRVPPSVMWAKFEALVAGARLASDELWR
jgi:5-methyltetrahydropteroyltriglutamate--homocysteine methyltransferase